MIGRMKVLKLLLLFFSFVFFSCASIPKEAPVLSEQLGKEINSLEGSHIRLVESFFELKRKNLRTFLEEKWLPEYAERFFAKPAIQQMWEQVSETGAEEDRLMFLLVTAPELQADINEQYQQTIEPLNQLERALKNALQEKYRDAMSINNTLTSFLVSAAEVDENRQRYLDMAGLTEDKISAAIDQTESLTSELLMKALDADAKLKGAENNIEDYKNKINDIIQKIK